MSSESNLISLINKTENLTKEEDIKCIIVLKAAGNAPIISNNKIKILGSYKVANLYDFVRKSLKSVLDEKDSLFLYCNNNFSPSLSSYIIDIHKNYSIKQELTIFYAISEAWG